MTFLIPPISDIPSIYHYHLFFSLKDSGRGDSTQDTPSPTPSEVSRWSELEFSNDDHTPTPPPTLTNSRPTSTRKWKTAADNRVHSAAVDDRQRRHIYDIERERNAASEPNSLSYKYYRNNNRWNLAEVIIMSRRRLRKEMRQVYVIGLVVLRS